MNRCGFLSSPARILLLALCLLATPAWTYAGSVTVIPTPNAGTVPDAQIDSRGVIHLAYLAGEDIYYVKSSDKGKTFSAPIRVNSEPATASGAKFRGPDLAVGKGGRVHVVWYGNGYQRKLPKDQSGVFYAHLDASGTAFVPARNLNHRPSDNYSLAADGRGKVAVFWTAGGAFVNRSDDDGDTFSEASKIDLADPCECCATRAYFSPDGNLNLFYRDKAQNIRDMYLMVLAKGGRDFSKEKVSATSWPINACPMTGAYLTEGSRKGLVAGWETKGQINFARLDRAGHPLSPGEIKVSEKGKYPVALTAPDGTTLVAWKVGETLEWQMIDRKGNLQGGPGSAPSGDANRPAGVVTKDGDFLLFP